MRKDGNGMVSARRYLRLATAAVITTLLATACSSNDSDSSSGTEGPDSQSTTFVTALSAQPGLLVRSFTSDAQVATVSMAMHEGLVRTTPEQDVVPALAESWDISEDGLEYTFHLRQDVSWHDGEVFNSEDVIFSLEEVLPLSPTGAVLQATIESVEAPDEWTVVMRLQRPLAPILLALGPQDFSIQPEHIYAGTDMLENPNNRAPVGTGPFRFDSWSGNTITLVRNEDYYLGAPEIERLIYRVIPDSNSRANAMITGEIDYINKFDVDDTIVGALSDEDDVILQNGRVSITMMTTWLNHEVEPLDDPEVRKALLTALDRELMSNAADADFTQPAQGSFPASLWAADPSVDYLSSYEYNPERAAQMLDDAGLPADGGSRFSVQVRFVPTNPYTQSLAAIMADNWGAIDIDVDLVQDETSVYNDAIFAQNDFGITFLSLDTRPDPEFGIGRVYKCNPAGLPFNNPMGYCNEELDDLFAEAAQAQGQEERTAVYARAQQLIDEELPAFTLLEMDQPDAIRSTFGGIDEFLSGALSGDLTWSALTP